MTKPLYINEEEKIPGLNLVVYCLKCKTNKYETCGENGKSLQACPFGEKHRFKLYYPDPNHPGKRLTKTFETRSWEEAQAEAQKIKDSLVKIKKEEIPAPEKPKETVPVKAPEISSDNLIALMSKYLTFISGDESVPLHLRKSRSKQYVAEIEHSFKCLLDSIGDKSYVASLKASEVDKNLVGKFFQFLKETKDYSNRTVNKNISFLRTFFHWVRRHEELQINNPFEFVIKLPEHHNPQAITKKEFDDLINVISPENGVMKCKGVKEHRNVYREYLITAYKMILFCGRRREEVLNMRFSDIIRKDNVPVMIAVPDRKVNHIKGLTGENQKINYVPITGQLLRLLNESGYEKLKGSDKFILAPGETGIQRNKVMADNLSRAFSHYIKQVSDRKLSMKSIRKAYLSCLQVFMGDAKAVSGHSGNSVLEQHYLDKALLAESLRNFEVFGKEVERKIELNNIRESKPAQEISLEK